MAWQPHQRAFYDKIWPSIQSVAQRTGLQAETIFAQAALESNWGRSAPNNNYFGIKGPGGSQTTREYLNGQWVTISDSFRGYSSMEASIQGYADFILNPRSRRWGGVKTATSPEAAARALQSGGYATDPRYADKLISIIRNMPTELRRMNPFNFGTGNPQQTATNSTATQTAPAENTFQRTWNNLFGEGGLQDRLTISPGEIVEHAENIADMPTRVLGMLAEPVKRTGFVVIGILLMAIAIFVILKGPQVAAKAAEAYVTKGKSVAKDAALQAAG